MTKSLATVVSIAALSLFAYQAQAADAPKVDAKPAEATKPATPQQEKMKMCNKDAEGKKGAERKAFMKSCLSGKPAEAAADAAKPADGKTTQQEKMKMCNKDATGKKGAERKAFMKECLKK